MQNLKADNNICFNKYLFLYLFLIIPSFSFTNERLPSNSNDLSVIAMDSLDLKIGQMILIGINDLKEIKAEDPLLQEIRSNRLGGIILFEKNISKSNPENTLKGLIAELQRYASIPLLVSIDEEGGKVHRLKEKYGFVRMPSAAYLGQLDNPDSTYFYNNRLAFQLHDLGINLNFAPTLDMAVNHENTVIVKNGRSFSADENTVTKHALQCIKAHHANGVLTILKHFPGHGSSTGDSHLGIVEVSETWSFREIAPFANIIQSGNCDAVMTAHIINKNWDTTLLPATLSGNVINGMLRRWMGFKGVIFSDDMQMNAISKNYGFENSITLAINAGVDILMFGNNVNLSEKPVTASQVHAIIKNLVLTNKISMDRINESYTRIMKLKSKIR